jgi:K+-transporting ATPase ATPase C chain
MAEQTEPTPEAADVGPPPSPVASWREQIGPALLGVVVLTVLTGVAFPLVLAALCCPLFPYQARGSLIRRDGNVVGSELIGQKFTGPGYFHARPSAAGDDGYDPTASGGSNLGPANPKLREAVQARAEEYRRGNGLPADAVIPLDAVTSSGSGLDPHISPADAALQVPRVARERGLTEPSVRLLVAQYTSGRQLGFLGEPRVAVLPLNLALDRHAPAAPPAVR